MVDTPHLYDLYDFYDLYRPACRRTVLRLQGLLAGGSDSKFRLRSGL
jgi:hypothetical protein